jgi:hypothetical protein
MPDCVDTAKQAMEPTHSDSPIDLAAAEADLDELPVGHRSVLFASQFSQPRDTSVTFFTHTVKKVTREDFSPPSGAAFSAAVRYDPNRRGSLVVIPRTPNSVKHSIRPGSSTVHA